MPRAFAQFTGCIGSALAAVWLMLAGCSPEPASSSVDVPAALELVDLEALPVDPFAEQRASVFIFLRTDCPISNSYAPEIRRLREAYAAQGVVFWMVYPDPDEATADIRRQLSEYQLTGPVLRDPKTALARRAQVHVTPEAAVFNARQELVYHGRIDDRFAAFGVKRPEPSRRDLADALDAVLAGRPVAPASGKAVGCSITFVP